jgi:hypothetical protein
LRDALALVALAALVSLPTLHTIAKGPCACVAGPSDFLAQNAPMESYFHDAVRREGALPLWRTDQLYGFPTLGDPQERILYPPFWVNAVLELPLAHHVYWLFHAVVLALGTYALARAKRCSRLASLYAGVAIGLSFKSQTYLLAGWDNIYGSIAWVPLALAGLESTGGSGAAPRGATWLGRARGAVVAGVALALSCLAGTPLFFAYLGPGIALAVLLAARGHRLRRLALLGLALGLGFALAAPELLATLAVSARSARALIGASYGATLPGDVIGALAFPDFTREDQSWELSNALGFAALPLAGAALASRRSSRSLGWLGLVFLVFAAGTKTPLGALLARVPLVGGLSYLSRLTWVSSIALAVLAGLGLDALERLAGRRRRRRLIAGAATGAVLLLVGALAPGRLERLRPENASSGAVLAALVLALLLAAAVSALPLLERAPRRRLLVLLVAATALELLALSELALVRVPWSELTSSSSAVESELAREPFARFAAVTSESIWADPILPFGAARGVERADGYNPLHTLDAERYLHAIAPDALTSAGHRKGRTFGLWSPYVGLENTERPGLLAAGVTHVVSHVPLDGFEVVAHERRRSLAGSGVWRDEEVYLERVPSALPRAFLMTRARAEGALTQRMAMRRGRFDGRRTLYVEGPVPEALEGDDEAPLPVSIVERRSNAVRLRASAPREGGWVVLLDAFSPDWSADVDGVPAPILRADAIFRAVRVEAGDHVVSMSVRWPGETLLGAGLALSAIAVAVSSLRSSRGPSPSRGGA